MSDRESSKVLMIQTPQGVLKIDLGRAADMPAPMAKAVHIFESALDKGVLDPLAETLQRLQKMAAEGDAAPLAAAMEIMKRVMAENQFDAEPEVKSEGTLKKLDSPENLN